MNHPIAQLQADEARAALDARAHQIAEELIGTARSKWDAMTQQEIDDPTLEAALNDLMFECDCCGWWCSTEELNNNGELEAFDEVCDECVRDGGDT